MEVWMGKKAGKLDTHSAGIDKGINQMCALKKRRKSELAVSFSFLLTLRGILEIRHV